MMVWEKVIVWVLGIVLLIVLILYLVKSLSCTPDTIVGKLFEAFGTTCEGKAIAATGPGTP